MEKWLEQHLGLSADEVGQLRIVPRPESRIDPSLGSWCLAVLAWRLTSELGLVARLRDWHGTAT